MNSAPKDQENQKEKSLNELSEQFQRFQTVEDLVDFFNSFITIQRNYPRKATIIRLQDLTFFLYGKKDNYTYFKIPKRRENEFRDIAAPLPKLKTIQKILNELFQHKFTPKKAAHGFIKGRDITTNAKEHINRKYVYNIDLKDFFPSINFGRVQAVLKLFPLKLSGKQARIIASLCCNKGILAQGSPTSPVISNMVCRRLDSKLSQFAKKNKARFTRFADDITFSSNKNIFDENFQIDLTKIIISEGFKINEEKIRLQTNLQRQVVTGLVVNKKLNVTSKYKKDLRFIIDFYNKDKSSAQNWLNKNYKPKRYKDEKPPEIENYIKGKFEFYKMVVGEKSHNKIVEKFIIKELEQKGENFDKIKMRFYQKIIGQNDYSKIFSQYKIKNEEETIIDKLKTDIPNLTVNNYDEIINIHHNIRKIPKKNLSKISDLIDSFNKFKQKNNNLEEVGENDFSLEDNFPPSPSSKEHNPRQLSTFLYRFKVSEDILGRVLHNSSNLYYEDIVRDFDICYNNEIEKNPFLPGIVQNHIKGLRNKLKADNRIKDFTGKKYDREVFNKILPIIEDFKPYIRLGSSSDETKMSNLIKFYFINKLDKVKFWRVDIDYENIDLLFQDIFTNVIGLSRAFSKIAANFNKHSSGVGIISFEVKRIANSILFEIIDLGSKPGKDYNTFNTGKKDGDLGLIKNTLKGSCNFSIKATFPPNNRPYEIPLLTTNKNNELLELKKIPNGFTYKLQFYKPIRVLLLDDGNNNHRIKDAEQIIKKKGSYSDIIVASTELRDKDLSDYNYILFHKNLRESTVINEFIAKYKTPVVRFSGGSPSEIIDSQDIVLSEKDFYDNLEIFLESCIGNGEPMEVFLKLFKNNKSSLNEEITNLFDKIDKNNVKIFELPIEYKQQIEKIIGDGTLEIPSTISNKKQLRNFIKQEYERYNNYTS